VKIRAATGSNCMFCVHAQRELNLARGYRNHTRAQACHNTSKSKWDSLPSREIH
jgi:hypothetical protein